MKWPSGIRSSGLGCGIKTDGASDLGLLASSGPVVWAGTFTKNAAAAAPVIWSRERLGGTVRAIVCNSGNANACTGAAGADAVRATAAAVAESLGCTPDEVLVASTGPIGVALPVEKILSSVPRLTDGLSEDVESFARSIMTTDTSMKIATASAGDAVVVGVAKGAAMCAPNMATMLAFIATDAAVGADELQGALGRAVDRSFNRVSIDGCESTNDSVFVVASGAAGSVSPENLARALEEVCGALAEQIALDAEGAAKLMRISVSGAADDSAAAAMGRAVADSVLWRCAVHGGDPNWGRILSALGSVERGLDLARVSVSIGAELVFDRGEPVADLGAAAKQMASDEIDISCSVGDGTGSAEVLSADTSPEYVLLNAEGTS